MNNNSCFVSKEQILVPYERLFQGEVVTCKYVADHVFAMTISAVNKLRNGADQVAGSNLRGPYAAAPARSGGGGIQPDACCTSTTNCVTTSKTRLSPSLAPSELVEAPCIASLFDTRPGRPRGGIASQPHKMMDSRIKTELDIQSLLSRLFERLRAEAPA